MLSRRAERPRGSSRLNGLVVGLAGLVLQVAVCKDAALPAGEAADQVSEQSVTQPTNLELSAPADRVTTTDRTRSTDWPASIVTERGGIELVLVPGGHVEMGSSILDMDAKAEESPRHRVELAPFYIGRYEVTNEQYEEFLDANPDVPEPQSWSIDHGYAVRRFDHPEQPVVGVSWEDAMAFAAWAGLALPTEAQWEYAARAGSSSRYWIGDDVAAAREVDRFETLGWWSYLTGPQRAGLETPANPWGLHDVHGNVSEWCLDPWDPLAYHKPVVDLRGLRVTAGQAQDSMYSDYRVARGGDWARPPELGRASARHRMDPEAVSNTVGFRVTAASADLQPSTFQRAAAREQSQPLPAVPLEYRLPPLEALRDDKSAWRLIWSFYGDGDWLRKLAWSPDGKHIAVERQVYCPIGHQGHHFTKRQNRAIDRAGEDRRTRYQDPRIVIFEVGRDDARELGIGREPAFSPSGRKLAYAHRKIGQSCYDSETNETIDGNPVAVQDLATGIEETWAVPEAGCGLEQPRWVDDSALVVSSRAGTDEEGAGDCVRTLWVSETGDVDEVAPWSGPAPVHGQGLYEWRSERRVWVSRAGEVEVGRLPEFDESMVDESFPFFGVYPVAVQHGRAIVLWGPTWKTLDLSTKQISTGSRLELPSSEEWQSPVVAANPSGSWVLVGDSSGLVDGVYVVKTGSIQATRIWAGPAVLNEAHWSRDGRYVAFVLSRRFGTDDPETAFAGDEIAVFEVPTRPGAREVEAYRWETKWR